MLGCTSYSGENGNKTEYSKGWADYWYIEIDGAGNVLKQFVIGGIGTDGFSDVICMGESKYILTGNSNSNVSGDKT